jgi:hypothetical protein
MDPLGLLGLLAIIIGVIGVVVLFQGKKKRKGAQRRTHA